MSLVEASWRSSPLTVVVRRRLLGSAMVAGVASSCATSAASPVGRRAATPTGSPEPSGSR
jgi:hypothetical protein